MATPSTLRGWATTSPRSAISPRRAGSCPASPTARMRATENGPICRSTLNPTATKPSPGQRLTGGPLRTLSTTLAAIGRARQRAMRPRCGRTPARTPRSECPTAMAAAAARGIRRMALRAAARRIWDARMASACIIASRPIEAVPMTRTPIWIAIGTLSLVLGSSSYLAFAQAPGPQAVPMSFFVTNVGLGKGGDLGGLAGADAHCQQLAVAAGGGAKTWHAYLSTQARPGQPAINARDRIGTGPWYNSKRVPIAKNLSDLNGDTVEEARLGSNLFKQTALNEKGGGVNGFGDMPNTHGMLAGYHPDGRAYTHHARPTRHDWL